MAAQLLDPELQRPRQQPVVGVEEDEQLAVALADAGVAGGREAEVLLADAADAGEALGDSARVVGRAVVDDDDLDLGVGLREDALDRLVEVAGLAEAGDDDRDQRRPTRRRGSRSSAGGPLIEPKGPGSGP